MEKYDESSITSEIPVVVYDPHRDHQHISDNISDIAHNVQEEIVKHKSFYEKCISLLKISLIVIFVLAINWWIFWQFWNWDRSGIIISLICVIYLAILIFASTAYTKNIVKLTIIGAIVIFITFGPIISSTYFHQPSAFSWIYR